VVSATRAADVIVVGLGAMGSAVAAHLARRGRRVIGFDRFDPPHDLGSSHGESRIIREAYFEGPAYVPMVRRAWALWEALGVETGRKLLLPCGGLMIGSRTGTLVEGVLASARAHGLEHELLDAAQVRARVPALALTDDLVAVAEVRAGVLFPEACIASHLEVAERHGADLRRADPVVGWRSDGSGVEVRTASETHRAAQLVLAAGAWLGRLVPPEVLPLQVDRQVAWWFEPRNPDAFDPARFPIYIWEHEAGRYFYGFPGLPGRTPHDPGARVRVKVARHREGVPADPDTIRRDVDPSEEAELRAILGSRIPNLDGPAVAHSVCMYTNTADGHFVVDTHPEHPEVTILSACSGHGFKFASALGESVAQRLCGESVSLDLSPFGLARLRG
jgi:sarcosine oxidase